MNICEFEITPIAVMKDLLQPSWSWISDSNGWSGFHLWYIFRNHVTIRTEGREYQLSEGDTFLFDLAKNHHCTHDPENPAGLFSAYFHCTPGVQLQMMLDNQVIPQQNHPELYHTNMELFEKAAAPFCTREETEIWLAPIFEQLLSSEVHMAGHDRITELCRMMDAAPEKEYSLDEMAARSGYSKNQLIRIFRRATGFTPYAYLIHTRIVQAKNLLLFSDYTVTEIAKMLGYGDLNHFSSQFYQKTGCYPSQYAARQRKIQECPRF